jgi:hypothetical protein
VKRQTLLLSLALSAAAGTLLSAKSISTKPSVTVLLQVDGNYSQRALESMKRESELIIGQAGRQLDFKFITQMSAGETFDDLVVVKLKGNCQMDSGVHPQMLDERGPYAWTFTADGMVLPFSEVQCDRVRESIKTAMSGSDWSRGDFLLGRAMGRVLAHELYHILGNTQGHGKEGVAKSALSARKLISERLDLHDDDCQKILLRSRK